ncbi:FAD-binding protein [Streptomyces mutabilis]|uniref:FAD-binding oxidoreductase n=1 Tax=Streptomyces mutabilis TaxID=67332 RepID=UPI00227D909D|nr:FAD-binding protein [Streptomyces mutabilis]
MPTLVALPASAAEVAAVVAVCAHRGIPFVARGAGTGLSGGALPVADGVVISLQRLRRVLEVDPANRRAVVEPGVTNREISRAAAPYGPYFAPDPSSQQVCTIGGNVAENSGGAHCLKYGFTVHHVLAAEVVLADGTVTTLGGDAPQQPGYDLLGAFIGSEGTLGVVTKVVVRLLPKPATVSTVVADFAAVAAACDTVSAVIAAGIVPAAIEMLDNLTIQAVESAVGADYTTDAAAALVVELDGPADEVTEQFDQVLALCRRHGSTKLRVAESPAERELIWRGLRALDGLLPPVRLRALFSRSPALVRAQSQRRLRVALLSGCAQRVYFSHVNEATARVLAAEGCEVVIPPGQPCCGALGVTLRPDGFGATSARKRRGPHGRLANMFTVDLFDLHEAPDRDGPYLRAAPSLPGKPRSPRSRGPTAGRRSGRGRDEQVLLGREVMGHRRFGRPRPVGDERGGDSFVTQLVHQFPLRADSRRKVSGVLVGTYRLHSGVAQPLSASGSP